VYSIIFPFPFALLSIIQFKFIMIMEYHINLHIKMLKMPKYYNISTKINIKMTSMDNKLYWEKNELKKRKLVGHICM
jgi:hypothetical protein